MYDRLREPSNACSGQCITLALGLMTKGTYLQVYALSFFAIPLVRWLLNKRRNAAIEERNQARMNAAAALERPALRRKLAAATKLANRTVIDDRDLVYSSDRCLPLAQFVMCFPPPLKRFGRSLPCLYNNVRSLIACAGVEKPPKVFWYFSIHHICVFPVMWGIVKCSELRRIR